MRRLIALVALFAALGACSFSPPDSSPRPTGATSPTTAQRAIAACPAAQTTSGGLPNLTLGCLGTGPAVNLSTLKGPLLINIWAGWCTPCMAEMPMLGAFYKAYGKKLPILGVDSGDTIPTVALNIAVTKGERFPQLVDQDMKLRNTPLTYKGPPDTFLLTASDKLVVVKRGAFNSEAELIGDLRKLGVRL